MGQAANEASDLLPGDGGTDYLLGVMDLAREPIAVVNTSSDLVLFNTRFASLLTEKWAAVAEKGRNLKAIMMMDPDVSLEFGEGLSRAMQGLDADVRIPCSRGLRGGQVAFKMRGVRQREGQICGIVLIASDAPERGIRRLRSAARFPGDAAGRHHKVSAQVAIEALEIGTFEIDLRTGSAFLDPREAELYGFPPGTEVTTVDEMTSRAHPDDRRLLREKNQSSAAPGSHYETEYRIMLPGGGIRWVAGKGKYLFDASGQAVRMVGINYDITRQRETETALRQSEERLRLAMLATRSLVYDWDIQTDYVYRSEGLFNLLGFLPGEAENKREWWYSRIHPDERDILRPRVERFLKGDESYRETEYRMVRKDGRVIHVRDCYHLVADEDGSPLRIVGSVTDISASREKQEEVENVNRALNAALSQLDSLLDNAPVGYAFFDADCKAVRANRFLSRMSGVPVQGGDGRTIDELLPGYSSAAREEIQKVFRTGRARRKEIGGKTPVLPELERCWYCVFYPVYGEGHSVEWVGMVALEITERKEAEKIISEREGFLRNTINSLFVLAGVCKPDGTVVDVNRAALAAAGLKAESVVGKKLEATYWWAHDRDTEARLGEAIEKARRGEVSRFDTLIRVRGGGLRPIDLQIGPMRDGEGAVTHLIFSGTDITERKHAEELLRENDRRKDEFLATLAHELRNPLAPISNAIQLLELPELPDEGRAECIAIMRGQLDHMVRLVDDLLDVSRISRGKINLKKQRVRLRQVIDHAVNTNRMLTREKGQSLDVCLADEGLELVCDPTRLSQVIGNLLSNASKYTHEGGRVSLRAWADGADAVISVEDDGIGIPKSAQEGIFDMFFQVRSESETGNQGLGIGLKLVRELVDLHHGSVQVLSEGEGKGSLFEVRIPLEGKVSRHKGEDIRIGNNHADLKCFKVLVVDDYVAAGRTTARVMELIGHNVRLAHHGSEALALIETWRPDIVLLDIGLPDVSGLDVCRAVRGSPEKYGTPFVAAITGWADSEHQKLSAAAGFDCHLIKPVPVARLEEISKSVGSKR